jgi:hypothetical protein
MFRIQRIVRKLKGIRLKPESKPEEGITRNNSFTIDEIGYEASSLLSQEEHRQKNRKS